MFDKIFNSIKNKLNTTNRSALIFGQNWSLFVANSDLKNSQLKKKVNKT